MYSVFLQDSLYLDRGLFICKVKKTGVIRLKEIQDKVYDAYYNKMGDEFGQKVRERVHWIVQNTKGNEILEVGCSQGITSILLGREGKNVLGIDVSEFSIQEAQNNLEKEEEETKQLVQFEKANFFLKEFDKQFDVVILGEVLEHISDIHTFFQKVVDVTKDGGTIIVTTPFGINDFIDHKRTFYLKDFFELQQYGAKIDEIKFFGKWIGVIFKRKSLNAMELNLDILDKVEEVLQENERELLEKNNNLTNQLKLLKAELKRVEEENGDNYKEMYLQLKTEKIHLQKQLVKEFDKQESLLENIKELKGKLEKLERHYRNLSNSKLGKITLKYWELRNKRRR